ncbi:hypothetical protein [Frankia sp. Cr2]|uniref:hypothetical protein n=1 Tax=Frankia sp. Cr2 TaxID=3073932 RepID=UPI002AD315D7|nr:hypothetical protein [Frankia sp. Cr2]
MKKRNGEDFDEFDGKFRNRVLFDRLWDGDGKHWYRAREFGWRLIGEALGIDYGEHCFFAFLDSSRRLQVLNYNEYINFVKGVAGRVNFVGAQKRINSVDRYSLTKWTRSKEILFVIEEET